jgi:hypothetical protein
MGKANMRVSVTVPQVGIDDFEDRTHHRTTRQGMCMAFRSC